MENGFRSIFLNLILALLLVQPLVVLAQDDSEIDEGLIEPQIERVEFDESLIDSEDFELSVFAGLLSIEDFGVNSVNGFKIAYHVNEDFFVQAVLGESNAGQTSFERLSGGAPLLSGAERRLEFYQFNIGYNLFPGESFLSESTTLNNTFYLSAGAGNTDFAGDTRFTINYGFGYRILFWDAFSLNADLRDHVFDLDVFGENQSTHNLEYSLALGWYF